MIGNKRNEEIEVLRACAIIMVFFHHLHGLYTWSVPGWEKVTGGLWSGVDLFFCISGFVIAKAFMSEMMALRGNEFWSAAGAFWIRRVYRLTPSAWLWIMLPTLFSAIPFMNTSYTFGSLRNNLSDTISAMAQVANLHWYACAKHYINTCGNFASYWTLSLEEQFYILFPFFIFIFRKRFKYVLAAGVLSQLFIFRGQFLGFLSFVRTDAIMLGVLIAIFQSSQSYKIFEPTFLDGPQRYVGALILISALCLTTSLYPVTFFMGLAAVISAAAVFVASYNKGYLFANNPLRKALVVIGLRSYAIYLIHIPVFWMVHEIWWRVDPAANVNFDKRYFWKFTLTAVLLLVVLVEANYRFVEEPLRKRGKQVANQFARRVVGHKEERPSEQMADIPGIVAAPLPAGEI